MTAPRSALPPGPRLALCLLACASRLVPAPARQEWSREWHAELHALHTSLRQSPRQSPQQSPASARSTRTLLAFALGSLPDAACLWQRELALHGWLQSPRRCLLLLCTAALLACGLCLALPGPRQALLPTLSPHNRHTFLIAEDDTLASDLPSLSFGVYDEWRRRPSQSVAQSAFYAPVLLRLQAPHSASVTVPAVLASAALLRLAPLTTLSGQLPTHDVSTPLLVLSQQYAARSAARYEASHEASHGVRHTAASPFTPGARLLCNGRPVQVAALVAASSSSLPWSPAESLPGSLPWTLPGHPDAWLLLPQATLAASPGRLGFVLARFTTAASSQIQHGRWQNSLVADDRWHSLEGASLATRAATPLLTLALALFLAFLVLPAATATRLGEYPRRLARAALCRRWLFLAAKLALSIAAVACSALDLAYALPAIPRTTSQYLAFALAFTGFLLAFRWALRDQKSRCPICLSILRNPVAVGHPSRFLLAFSGTEWICSTGHGFLHVPALETSWFRAQRWLDADASWHTPLQP